MNYDMTTEDLDYVAKRDEAQALRAALPYIEAILTRLRNGPQDTPAETRDLISLRRARALILRRLEVL